MTGSWVKEFARQYWRRPFKDSPLPLPDRTYLQLKPHVPRENHALLVAQRTLGIERAELLLGRELERPRSEVEPGREINVTCDWKYRSHSVSEFIVLCSLKFIKMSHYNLCYGLVYIGDINCFELFRTCIAEMTWNSPRQKIRTRCIRRSPRSARWRGRCGKTSASCCSSRVAIRLYPRPST